MNNNNYTVYMHICPNGKRYIGCTGQAVKRRWSNGKGYRYNNIFYDAIKMYGWKNIEHIIISENLSETEAKDMEVELISKYKSYDLTYGYNKTFGGKENIPNDEARGKLRIAKTGSKHSEETKRKMSESRAGDKSYFYGKHHSEDSKKKISEGKKGRKMSDDTIIKMSESMTGEKNPRYIERTPEMINDIRCGMCYKDFTAKYSVGETTYYRMRKQLSNLNRKD